MQVPVVELVDDQTSHEAAPNPGSRPRSQAGNRPMAVVDESPLAKSEDGCRSVGGCVQLLPVAHHCAFHSVLLKSLSRLSMWCWWRLGLGVYARLRRSMPFLGHRPHCYFSSDFEIDITTRHCLLNAARYTISMHIGNVGNDVNIEPQNRFALPISCCIGP